MGRRSTRRRGSTRTPPWRRAGWVVGAVAALVLAAGCSSGDGSSAGTTEPDGSMSALANEAVTDPSAGVTPGGTDPLPRLPDHVALPIVFVHGEAGSAQQFESQAQRFEANGYPPDRIIAFDHDGARFDVADHAEGLATVVDAALAEFETDQVYLVGHSRGTEVITRYLRARDGAAKVAKYVAIDGEPCPDAVPCTAITQDVLTGQSHFEVATSKESFELQYEFLVGTTPQVVHVVPQRAPVEIFGRALTVPADTAGAATLDIWPVDSSTGHRITAEPLVSVELDERGGFGPVRLQSGAHYEYVLTSDSSPVRHHIYLQPYVRSSHLVRLLSSEPGGPNRANTNVDSDHSSLVVLRNREWYAVDDPDVAGDQRDVLTVAPPDGQPVDVLPGRVGNRAIAIHVHDDTVTPGRTTLAPLPYFSEQPFQAGVDVHLPSGAGAEAPGTITVTNLPRGDTSRPQMINVPNWPSDRHAITVMFNDHPVD